MNTTPRGANRHSGLFAPISTYFVMLAALLLAFLPLLGSQPEPIIVEIQPVPFSIDSPEEPPYIAIYPNPATEYLEIHAAQGVHFIGIKIYDAGATLVFQANYTTGVTWTASLLPGTYDFHVDTSEGTEVVRIVIQA